MKGMLEYGSQVKRPWYMPQDERVRYGMIGGIAGALVFLPVLYITLLLWELIFFVPYYGGYLLLKALPLLYLFGIATSAYLGISFGQSASQRWPGVWGYRAASALGGLLAASFLASALSGLSVLIEIII